MDRRILAKDHERLHAAARGLPTPPGGTSETLSEGSGAQLPSDA